MVKPGAGHGWGGIDKDIAAFADWFDSHLKRPGESKADDGPIPSAQARDHVGERRTVETTIKSCKDAVNHREYYLDSETDFNDARNLAVVISYDHADKFKAAGIENPAEYFKGKTIRVTGTIVQEGEQVRIRVDTPVQIKVVE